jgi:hypothetical protein
LAHWPGPRSAAVDASVSARRGAGLDADAGFRHCDRGFDRLCSSSNLFWLAGPECDDAADRIVRRHADCYSIPGNHLDAEAAHSAAELREDFMASITLHAV